MSLTPSPVLEGVNHDRAPTIYLFFLAAPEQTPHLLDEKTDLPEITGLNLRAAWGKLLGTPQYSLRKKERDLQTKMRKNMESSPSVDEKLT